jgi:hypothetical protein
MELVLLPLRADFGRERVLQRSICCSAEGN